MTARNTTLLIAAAILFSALAWFLSQRQQAAFAPTELGLLEPTLEARLDELDRVEIQQAGGERFALVRENAEDWVLPERNGYPVDVSKLRKLLRTIATVEVVEAKTANPEWHDRLKLQDLSEAADTTVELLAKAGEEPVLALLIGKTGQGGHYVRRVGENQTWLVGENLNSSPRPVDWLDKSLIDIKRADLDHLYVKGADGKKWSLQREADSTDFTLEPSAPEGREVSGANVNRLLTSLENLRLLEVRAADESDATAEWRHVHFAQKNGLHVHAEARQDGSKYWLRLSAEAKPVVAATPAEAEEGESPEPTVSAKVAEAAAALNRRAGGRVFEVSSYPGAGLLMEYERMLKELPREPLPE